MNSQEGDSSGLPNGTSARDHYLDGTTVGKPSKPRHMNPNRTTMNDMKRRVAGILEFISHTQVEMAALDPPLAAAIKKAIPDNDSASAEMSKAPPQPVLPVPFSDAVRDMDNVEEEVFGALTSIEMMEVLTRKLMRWQGEYGKWGDK